MRTRVLERGWHWESVVLNRPEVVMLHIPKNGRMRNKQPTNLQRRYGYLENAFDGDSSRCLAWPRANGCCSQKKERVTNRNVLKGEPRQPEHVARHPFGKVPVFPSEREKSWRISQSWFDVWHIALRR